jgi:hypothetical protein
MEKRRAQTDTETGPDRKAASNIGIQNTSDKEYLQFAGISKTALCV